MSKLKFVQIRFNYMSYKLNVFPLWKWSQTLIGLSLFAGSLMFGDSSPIILTKKLRTVSPSFDLTNENSRLVREAGELRKDNRLLAIIIVIGYKHTMMLLSNTIIRLAYLYLLDNA